VLCSLHVVEYVGAWKFIHFDKFSCNRSYKIVCSTYSVYLQSKSQVQKWWYVCTYACGRCHSHTEPRSVSQLSQCWRSWLSSPTTHMRVRARTHTHTHSHSFFFLNDFKAVVLRQKFPDTLFECWKYILRPCTLKPVISYIVCKEYWY
jgi:hypothetical protein